MRTVQEDIVSRRLAGLRGRTHYHDVADKYRCPCNSCKAEPGEMCKGKTFSTAENIAVHIGRLERCWRDLRSKLEVYPL